MFRDAVLRDASRMLFAAADHLRPLQNVEQMYVVDRKDAGFTASVHTEEKQNIMRSGSELYRITIERIS